MPGNMPSNIHMICDDHPTAEIVNYTDLVNHIRDSANGHETASPTLFVAWDGYPTE